MDYIDIHSHITFADYGQDLLGVLINMRASRTATITVGADYESSKQVVELASQNSDVFACVGFHPDENHDEVFSIEKYEELVKQPRVVAVGECGLDYFRLEEKFLKGETLNREKPVRTDVHPGGGLSLEKFYEQEIAKQKEIFQAQISLAKKYDKPLMIHVRDAVKNPNFPTGRAYEDVLSLLEGQGVTGNVHFFAGSWETAQKFLNLGFTLSFTGVITFTHNYDEVIKKAPLNMIMAETDAPFVAPVPFRGQRNEPCYVSEMVKKIAEIRGEELEWVKHNLLENAKRVFKINL